MVALTLLRSPRVLACLALAVACFSVTPGDARPSLFGNAQPPSGIESVLFTFSGGNGKGPNSNLIADQSGRLYGTSEYGGGSNIGTVFRLTPSGSGYTESVLYSFSGSDGRYPLADLVADTSGALYGTTCCGGSYSAGSVFKLTPSGGGNYNESTIYNFTGGSDGYEPYFVNLILDKAGALYGTTRYGGAYSQGTVFKLAPSGSSYIESVLYNFTGSPDSSQPLSGLLADKHGALYGTSETGGTYNDGAVFKLAPTGSGYIESVIASFTGYGGSSPGLYPEYALVADSHGVLYGMTVEGGPYGYGNVFSLTPAGSSYTESTLHIFTGGSDGGYPNGSLLVYAGAIFGTVFQGGSSGHGVVFALLPSSSGYVYHAVYNFAGGNDGSGPESGLSRRGSTLYGVTFNGGSSSDGTAYEIRL